MSVFRPEAGARLLGAAMTVAAVAGVLALPVASAQDGSGVQATREAAERFLEEALVRPGISGISKPAASHWLHPTKNRCEMGLSNHRGGCVWRFEITFVESKDCRTNIFLKVDYEPDTDLKPEDRILKPSVKVDTLGFAIDWRTVKLSTFHENRTQANAIKIEGLADPWGSYFNPNFNLTLKDGSSDRVLRAMQYLQNACALKSDTGF